MFFPLESHYYNQSVKGSYLVPEFSFTHYIQPILSQPDVQSKGPKQNVRRVEGGEGSSPVTTLRQSGAFVI